MNAEDAFTPTRDRAHFFASTVAEVVLSQMQAGLDHELPVMLVTGEPDVGKSSVVREACARWGARVRAEWLTLPDAAPEALLEAIVKLFGGKARGDDSRTGWLAALSRVLGIVSENDKLPVLIVEDADTFSLAALVELANIHLAASAAKRTLRMILLGTRELEAKLEDLAVDPLAKLVGVRSRLAPMPPQDVRHYLHHRIAAKGGDGDRVFSRKAARELHVASRGVPGALDVLAAESIRCARNAGTSTVGQEHVRAAVTAVKRFTPAPAEPAAAASPPAAPVAKPAPKSGAMAKPAARPAAPPKPAAAARPVARAPVAPDPPPPPAPAAPAVPEAPPVAKATPAKPATAPGNGKKTARPVPKPSLAHRPFVEPSPLDSRHPRVKEWVSRFTEGDAPIKFGARLNLPPITDPDSLPTLDASAREPEPELLHRPAREPEPEPVEQAPAPIEPEQIVIVPEPIVLEPEPIVLGPDAVSPVHESAPPKPAPQGSAKEKRKARRQREREEAAQASVAAHVAGPPPGRAAAAPAPAPSRAAAAARPDAIREPVLRELPELSEPDSGEPARMLTGPLASRPSRFLHVVVPGMLMLGVAGVAIWAGTRGGFERDLPFGTTQVSSSTPSRPAPADTMPSEPAVEDTNAFDPLASPPAEMQASAETAVARPPAETTVARPPAQAKPARFCLAVGTYLFSDRARIVSRELSRRTGLDAWVETGEAGGARNYKILLGGFSTQDSAERTADTLLSRGIVSEAMVEPMPSGRKPR